VIETHLEAMFLTERPLYGFEQVFVAVDGLATLTTYQVMMVSFLGVMVYSMIGQLALKHASVPFQQIERAVYGGLVYLGHPGLNVTYNLFRGEIRIGLVDSVYYQPALRCEFESLFL
jgi:hypothetical protein